MRRVVRSLLLGTVLWGVLASAASAANVEFRESEQDQDGTEFAVKLLIVTGDGAADAITITETPTLHVVESSSAPLVVVNGCTLAGTAVNCPRATSIAVDLGAGHDRLATAGVSAPMGIAGADGNDTLAGGNANDVLAGGEGLDAYFGEAGDDTVDSRDGLAERISCGAGADEARNDFIDIIAECERGFDGDQDGFSTAVDCNDAMPGIFPGAREIVENGIDEDCDGRDALNLDRDGDGFPVPLDCNDADAAIRPGTLEIRGNAVDENCDNRAEPFARLPSLVSTKWVVTRSSTRLRTLVVRNAPQGAQISVRCTGRGCRLRGTRRRRVPRDLAPVNLSRDFRTSRLRPGARVTVQIAAAGAVTRFYDYTVRRLTTPTSRTTCQIPGQGARFKC